MPGDILILRPVAQADLPAVAEIYNHYVAHSTCTFDTEPRQPAEWQTWLAEHVGPLPAIVALRNGECVGWGSLSRWNNRCAYRHSVENSVYVKTRLHRQGIGRSILMVLIDLAREHRHRNVIAQIADAQTASEALHAQLGFQRVGVLSQIGFKFGRWIDVAIWQLKVPGE